MFTTKEASESGQWHNVKPQPSEKEMSHLADGEAWQDFDTKFLDLQKMQENLGLALPLTASIHFRKRTQSTACCLCLWCHIYPSTMGMHGRVKLHDGFAYPRSGITQEGC
jgi:hypothetical protein